MNKADTSNSVCLYSKLFSFMIHWVSIRLLPYCLGTFCKMSLNVIVRFLASVTCLSVRLTAMDNLAIIRRTSMKFSIANCCQNLDAKCKFG